MDLRHTGSDELVYIQTQSLTLTIKGSAFHPLFPSAEFQEKESNLSIVCDEDYDIALSGDPETVFSQFLGKTYSGTYKIRPIFFEQQRYELVIEPEEGHTVSFWHENYNIRKRITPVGRDKKILSGEINFGSDIGMSDLFVSVDGSSYLKLTLEVFPSKISYKDDYKAIVSDVTAEVYNLVFDFLKKTYDSFDISSSQQSSPVEFFAIIRKIYGDFVTASDMILRNPHHLLQTEHEVLPWHKIKRSDNSTIRWLEKHSDQVVRTDGKIKAEKALAVKKYVTYDTKENRLTKYMLMQTAHRLEQFKKQYLKLDRESDQDIIRQIDTMIKGINRRCNTGFMLDVNPIATKSGMSLVFGMAPGYRELYRCYLLLQHGLTVTGSVFNVSIKDLAVLYEYWCFIKLNSLMKEKYKLISQDIIRVSGAGLFVSLIKGQRSRVVYKNPKTGETITLSYNPKEINVPTVTQRPDNVLQLEKTGAETKYEYVFDAKYKVNPALEGTDYYTNISHTPGPQVDDINTMHRYRDAIVYQNDASPYERTMFGAYVLFPYQNEKEYKEHRFYKSIDQVNIGGLPFLPSATNLVTEMLDELVSDSADSAFERAILPIGIERKLAKVDWNKRDVLVGTVKDKQQLDVCLEKKFYYIPASRVEEDNLPIHYIAVYQTKAIFGAEAKIQYYGEVKSTRLAERRNISEIPEDSDELYYRFEIKSWKKLDRPIDPKERGFASMFTNFFLLTHSSYVPELLLKSEEEYRFYSELKRRTDASVINEENSVGGFLFGESKVSFNDGRIILIQEDKIVESCTITEFAKTPNASFRRLMSYVKNIEDEIK